MKRKLLKILLILFLILIVFNINANVFATTSGSSLVNQFSGENGNSSGDSLVENIIGPILSVVRIVAVGIAIIMLTYLGIKYMTAAPSEKATIKNQLITFTIGAIIVVAATSILDIIKNFTTNNI